MNEFWIGLLALPALAVAGALVWAAWTAAAWVYINWFDPSLTSGRYAYAYQVTSATGHLAQQLIGVNFIESRYRGKKYTYRLEFNGFEKLELKAEFKGRGSSWGKWAEWDTDTAEALDKTPGGSDR
jgi:hypothetical protein